jgi:hypothetical protein
LFLFLFFFASLFSFRLVHSIREGK